MIFFGVLGNLIPLFVIVAIVMLVRRARSGDAGPGDAGVSLRRLLEYGFLAVVLGLAATGVGGLLEAVVETVREGADGVDPPSWSFTSLLVGGVALLFFVRNLRRRFAETPGEQGALGWVLYLGLVEMASLVAWAFAADQVLEWVVDNRELGHGDLPNLVVWGAVWVVHVRLGDRVVDGQPVRTPLVPFAVSLAALAALAGSVGWIVALTLMEAYEAIAGYTPWGGFREGVQDVLPTLLLSGALWWWYWLRQAAHDRGSLLHHAYTLFVGVLGGFGTLVGVTIGLVVLFVNWGFAIGDEPADEYFSNLPPMLAVAAVAALAWRHHRRLLPPAEGRPRNDVDRAADHLAAWVGVGALLAGVTVVLFVLFHHLTPAPVGAEREATMVVIVGLPLLAIGGLVWRRFWQSIQERAGDPAEVGSVVRRAYLYVIFGVSGVSALATSLFLVFSVIDGAFNQSLDRQAVWDLHAPLAIAVTAGVAAGYHRRVMRADRAVLATVPPASAPAPSTAPAPAPERRGPSRVVVVAADPAPLAAAVEMATGATVEMVRRGDPPPVAFDLDMARMEVAESDADALMVVVGPDGSMLAFPID